MRADKAKAKSEDTMAIENSTDSEGNVLTVSLGRKKLDWILNYGCSFHICTVKNYFSTYEVVIAKMASNTVNKVVSVETVRFRMHDGSILKLAGVRHVLGSRKNLISLRMLDSQGCKFLSSDGVLEVFMGDRVMLRGIKVGNLFRRVGGVLTRGAKVKHHTRSMDGWGEQGD